MQFELFWFLVGAKLGSGIHRDVYDFYWKKGTVIKIAKNSDGRLANSLEYGFWENFKNTELKKWFAPCHGVSAGGRYLIQSKAEFGRKKEYPDKIPNIFTDKKYKNYGWIKDQLVCVDYSSGLNISKALKPKLIKANFWEE